MKKSFTLFTDSLDAILPKMNFEQKGMLLDAMWKFHKGEELDLDFGIEMAFGGFKAQFIRDIEKYNETVERNKTNGLRGGRPISNPSGSENNPNNPSGLSETQPIPLKPYTDTDTKTDTKTNTIEERKLKFTSDINAFANLYAQEMINEFVDYWTEPNRSNTKFKQEGEKTWDSAKRLKRWSDNNFNKRPKMQTPAKLLQINADDIFGVR